MLTTTEAFEKFRQRLELSETESKDAARRHTDVRESIRGGFEIENDFLSGSYRRHTKTKPLKDVDIFFVLGEKERWRRSQAPIETLKAFEKCLKAEFDETELCRRAVTVTFEKSYYPDGHDGKVMSIDAVPAFLAETEVYEIPDKVLGKWKDEPEEACGAGDGQERGVGRQVDSSGEDGQGMEPGSREAHQTFVSGGGHGRGIGRGPLFKLRERSAQPPCGDGGECGPGVA